MYFWAVVTKCFKIAKMREPVVVLKIQFMLKYRVGHSSLSEARLIFLGFFFTKGVEQGPSMLGEEHSLYSFVLATLTVTLMKRFLTILTYLLLCLQMPFNQVTGFLSTAEWSSLFQILVFHVCNFFSLKGNFIFLISCTVLPECH